MPCQGGVGTCPQVSLTLLVMSYTRSTALAALKYRWQTLWYFSWPAVSQISSFREAVPTSTTFVKNAPERRRRAKKEGAWARGRGLRPGLSLGRSPGLSQRVRGTCFLSPPARRFPYEAVTRSSLQTFLDAWRKGRSTLRGPSDSKTWALLSNAVRF